VTAPPSPALRRDDVRYGVLGVVTLVLALALTVTTTPSTVLTVAVEQPVAPATRVQVRLPVTFVPLAVADTPRAVGVPLELWWWVAAAAAGHDGVEPFTASPEPWVLLTVSEPALDGQETPALEAITGANVVGTPTTRNVGGRFVRSTTVRFVAGQGPEIVAVEHRTVTDRGLIVSLVAGCARGCAAARAELFDSLASALEVRP